MFGGAPTPQFKVQRKADRTGLSPLEADGAALAPEPPQITFSAAIGGQLQEMELVQTNPAYSFMGPCGCFSKMAWGLLHSFHRVLRR